MIAQFPRPFLVSLVLLATSAVPLLFSSPASAQDPDASAADASAAEATAVEATAVEAAPAPDLEDPLRFWPADQRSDQRELEDFLVGVPAAERLADWHERFSSEPHMAGTEGDARMIEKMGGYFESMGLEVEVHRFWTWLPSPVSARLEIVQAAELDADDRVFGSSDDLPMVLPIRERAIEENQYSEHPDLGPGWNAYSGSGEVTAGVVYANYGTKQDFEQLRALGIDLGGKIVIARYGGNFRGFKAKFAEEAGAAGLVIFTDPGDAGYAQGATYPDGGWANATYIQRGSLKALSYPGDPLTPFVEATADAQRLAASDLALPSIPVQPIGWGAAYEILRRMRGGTVPRNWQGGLPLAYRLEGGDELVLRLRVEQESRLVETANVLGYLRGATHPEELVIVGSHHDAWTFGAGDPNAGTILVFEAARAFADALREGYQPARTLVFANWGAEEFGIIGSTEWVEARRDELMSKAVAYINLDGAAMGTRFRSSSSPSLQTLIADVAKEIPQARDEDSSVYDTWVGDREAPRFGNLGGGSDHVGFYCHTGVPSAGLSAGGSPGVSYHSNYEDLHWYRQVVGDDYVGAIMLTRFLGRMLSRLAGAPILPLDPVTYAAELERHLAALEERATELDVEVDFSALHEAGAAYGERAANLRDRLLGALASGTLTPEGLGEINATLLTLERQWLRPQGLPERPWFRNLFAATDPDSGYAAWMLPGLRWAIERDKTSRMDEQLGHYLEALGRLGESLDALEAALDRPPVPDAVAGEADGPEAAATEPMAADPNAEEASTDDPGGAPAAASGAVSAESEGEAEASDPQATSDEGEGSEPAEGETTESGALG